MDTDRMIILFFGFVVGALLIGIPFTSCQREERLYKLRFECLKSKSVEECNKLRLE